jgi:hypothetical protein
MGLHDFEVNLQALRMFPDSELNDIAFAIMERNN